MRHYRIKPDERGLPMEIASMALSEVRGLSTARPGSMYIPNGDGTGTLIGELAGTDGTGGANGVAPWVGDTTPPGRPSGVSCSSAWGTLYVSWDGTLEGGVPADFAYVSVLVDGQEVERLTGAGTAVREDLENGSTVQVSAVAYDAARDELGNPAPNASEPWGPVAVQVSDERAELDAEVEQIRKDAEEAGAKADKVAEDAADALRQAQETVEQVTADVAEAKEAAQAASDKADGYAQQIADATATVNGVKQDVSELTTKVEGAAKDAAGALTAATEAKQTATEVSTTAERAYEDAQSALHQSSQAVQTATGVKTTLETEYVSKADASSTYSTKAEVEATSSKLSASITEAAETAEAAQAKALEVEATASGLSTTITQVSQKADAAQSTADGAVKQVTTLKATVDGVSSAVTKAQSTADSAVSAASKAQQTVDGFKTEVSQKYQPKGDYATEGDLSKYQPKGDYATKSSVEQTASQIKQQVADTYATKSALEQEKTDRQSAITQSASSIKSEVSKTYLSKSDASNTYATKASLSSYATKSSVEQTADQIKQEVSETYATQEDVDGISIGGTNLLMYTAYENLNGTSVRGSYATLSRDTSNTYQGRTSLKLVASAASVSGAKDAWQKLWSNLTVGDELVLSFWAKGSVAAKMWHRMGGGTSNGGSTAGTQSGSSSITTSWKRYEVSLGKVTSTGNSGAVEVIYGFDKAGTFYLNGMKLEVGNRATDWSPAPEDMLSTADAAATYATKSSVTQTASEIKSEVATTYLSKANASSTYATKTEMKQSDDSIKSTVSSVKTTADSALKKATTVEQTADGLEVKIDSAVTTANTAKTTADSAKSTATTANNTANSAKTAATNAQNTANTAKTNASTALSTANSAKTTATNAQNTANAAKKQTYHSASGTSGTKGYVRFAQVKFSGAYLNRPVFFALSNCGQAQSNVWVQWSSTSSNDPSLASIKADGGINVWAHKTATSTWEIIAQKSEGYDTIYVNDYSNNNGSDCAVSWVNVQLSSVPSGSTAATRLAGKRNSADIDNAAKTATNYLGFSSGGLVVGTNSGGTGQSGLQGNVRTYSGGMEVRNGTTVLARYGASSVELGINSTSSQIKMCGGKGYISYGSHTLNEGSASNCFTINSSDPIYLNSSKGVYINGLSALRGRGKTKAGGHGLVWYYITLTGGITIAFGQAQISSGSGSTIEYAFSDYSTPDSSLFKFYVVNATVERMSNPTAYDANWEVTPIVTRTSSSKFRVTLMRGDYAFLAPNSKWYIDLVAFGWNESAD